MGNPRVVILTPDRVAARQAGIAMRHVGIARALARRGFEVVLASTDPASTDPATTQPASADARSESRSAAAEPSFAIVSNGNVRALVEGAQACLVQGSVFRILPQLLRCEVPLIVDLVCPVFLENLDRYRDQPDELARHAEQLDVFRDALGVGDHFVCGNERQRHYWLGMLTALGRVNPAATRGDPDLRQMVGLLPHGLPAEPPRAGPSMLAGLVPDLRDDDVLCWWGGGLWDWLDAETPIRAAARLAERGVGPRVRVLFTGLQRPQDGGRWTRAARRARDLAEELGVLDREVVFADGWVAADELPSLLAEVHVGLSAHGPSLETTFSLRTRFWTYVWGKLPVIMSAGDHVSEMVREHQLGAVVGMGDVDDWTEALRLAAGHEWRARCAASAERLAPELTWDRAVDELATSLERGLPTRSWKQRRAGLQGATGPLAAVAGNVAKVRASISQDGLSTTFRRSWRRLSPQAPPPVKRTEEGA